MVRSRGADEHMGRKRCGIVAGQALIACFFLLVAVVAIACVAQARSVPDNVGRPLSEAEQAEVIARNSPLATFAQLSPNADFPREGAIDTITVHHTASVTSLEQLGQMFSDADRQSSSNYGIDAQGNIGLFVEEGNRAFSSSDRQNDSRAVTIEVSNDEVGGDWRVSDASYDTLIDLIVDICERNGIEEIAYTGDPDGTLTTHKMFNPSTECPGPYLDSRMPEIAQEVNERLEAA